MHFNGPNHLGLAGCYYGVLAAGTTRRTSSDYRIDISKTSAAASAPAKSLAVETGTCEFAKKLIDGTFTAAVCLAKPAGCGVGGAPPCGEVVGEDCTWDKLTGSHDDGASAVTSTACSTAAYDRGTVVHTFRAATTEAICKDTQNTYVDATTCNDVNGDPIQ